MNPEAPFDDDLDRHWHEPPPTSSGWWSLVAVFMALVLIGLAARSCAAQAHDAPSGWKYPSSCCSDGDCRPVGCGSLHEVEGGIEWLGVVFPKTAIRHSEDGYCHVCVGTYGVGMDHRVGHCVFMTPRT